MASVVPPLTPIMQAMAQRYFGRDAARGRSRDRTPACRSSTRIPRRSAPIASRTASPRTNGTGAAAKLPLIVADLGTATTFDAVTAKGEYLGGVDLPGSADRRGSAVSARRAAAARRRAQADDRHRANDGRRDRVRPVLRLPRDGRGARRAHDRRARRHARLRIATGGLAPLIVPETICSSRRRSRHHAATV